MRRFFSIFGLSLMVSCSDPSAPITIVEPPDAGCEQLFGPSSYEVYFVVDVSGSMTPYLTAIKNEMISFADSFAQEDANGDPITIDYFVVAYVNDARYFPDPPNERITTATAVADALQDAIDAGEDGQNLNLPTINAEDEENLLDALQVVIDNEPSAEANLIIIATDATFRETPYLLSGNNEVQSTYDDVRAGLAAVGAGIHSFTPNEVDGVTRSFAGRPSLTSLPNSTVQILDQNAADAQQEIQDSLEFIAIEAACTDDEA